MKKNDNTELIPKTPKSGKTLKAQLFSAVAMMLVATIALGSSTYAWFINNQAVAVQTMNLTVSTSTSLLAAVGKPSSVVALNTTYADANFTNYKTTIINDDIKNVIDATNASAGWTGFFTNPMTPASVCDTQLALTSSSTAFPAFYKSMDKLVDGRVSEFELLTHDGTTVATDKGLGQGAVKHIRLALKSSVANLPVFFGEGTDDGSAITIDKLIVDGTGGGDATQTAAIKKALRLAIVPTGATVTPKVFQFDDAIAAGNANNTYYSTTAANATNDKDGLIEDTTGLPNGTAVGSDKGIYPAVGTVVTGTHLIETVVKQTAIKATTDSTAYFAKMNNNDKLVTKGTTPLFTMPGNANTPLVVDIYIWLEGTDEDCLNALSSYKFGIKIPFMAPQTAA